jgi:hypothetical protein
MVIMLVYPRSLNYVLNVSYQLRNRLKGKWCKMQQRVEWWDMLGSIHGFSDVLYTVYIRTVSTYFKN